MSDGYGMVQIKSNNTLYDFGIVTKITDVLNKSITSIPIVSLPTDSTFALESNTSNKYEIHFSRKNPLRLNGEEVSTYESDEDYFEKSWKWTNDLWVTAVSSLLNRWQVRSDGYRLFVNVEDVGKSVAIDGRVYEEITNLFPSHKGVNVYISDISITLNSGHTEYITGTLTVVVGGRLTEKLSVDTSSDYILFDQYKQKFNSQGYNSEKGYVGIRDYNTHNEYNDYIQTSESTIFITAIDIRNGKRIREESLPLMIGAPYKMDTTMKKEWEYDYSNTLDLVTSYTLKGGVENPFEKLILKMSKRAFIRTYPDVGVHITEETDYSNGYRVRIVPGISKIKVYAVGAGTYTVTECSLSNNTYTITAYCDADRFRGLAIPPEGQQWSSPLNAVLDLVGKSEWGLDTPYGPHEIITNVRDIPESKLGGEETVEYLKKLGGGQPAWALSVNGGTNIWVLLQACAYMLNAKIFFSNNRVFLIDYTTLLNDIPEYIRPEKGSDECKTSGNRLIVRSGLDRGMYPTTSENIFWGIEALDNLSTIDQVVQKSNSTGEDYLTQINEYNSIELHTENSLDRVAGRMYGTVTQDSQGTTTVYNTVYVKFNARVSGRDVVRTLWFGRNTIEGEGTFCAEWISKTDKSDLYEPTNDSSPEYDTIKRVAETSIRYNGVSEYELDLTSYFRYLPVAYARRMLYAVLNYRAEPQETIKFTLNERCSGTLDENSTGYGDSYWSALFPLVCAARQFTDIEQELKVSAIGNYISEFFPQKLALSKYDREYPSGRTTYTFGVTNSIDLASSTSYIMTRTSR